MCNYLTIIVLLCLFFIVSKFEDFLKNVFLRLSSATCIINVLCLINLFYFYLLVLCIYMLYATCA